VHVLEPYRDADARRLARAHRVDEARARAAHTGARVRRSLAEDGIAETARRAARAVRRRFKR
jgi:hypothetical protein